MFGLCSSFESIVILQLLACRASTNSSSTGLNEDTALKLCTVCLQGCYSPVLRAHLKYVIRSVTLNAVPELSDRSSISTLSHLICYACMLQKYTHLRYCFHFGLHILKVSQILLNFLCLITKTTEVYLQIIYDIATFTHME